MQPTIEIKHTTDAADNTLFGVDKPVSIVIWTTTPWTLPANEAVALHPELDYVLVDTGNEYLLLAQALAENALSRYDMQGATIGEKTFSGSEICSCLNSHMLAQNHRHLLVIEWVLYF
jgi:isoleucyl-tRNA synthetase